MSEPATESKVRIPEQILKQAEESERLHQEFMASMNRELGITGTMEKPSAPTGNTGKSEPVKEETVIPPELDELKKAREKAEQQYRVLQGKYNAEVPEFALKLTEALNKINRLEAELSAAKSHVSEPERDVLKDIDSDPSIQYLKTDLPDVWKAVNLVIEKKTSESVSEVKKLREELESQKKTTAITDRDRFYGDLSKEVKGWEKINVTPEWVDWLKETDPYSGRTRQELINDAYAKMDSGRTARFFTDYIEQSGLVKDKTEPVSKKEVANEEPVKAKKDIVPDTVKTKKPDLDAANKENKEKIKASEVTMYYRELERLTRMGQAIPDDLKIRGIQIDKAVMEGRVE